MARVVALLLFLVGLVAQPMPVAASAMPGLHESAAMEIMADCTDCVEDAMPGGDACKSAGGCAAGAAALWALSSDSPFTPAMREIRPVYGGAAPAGGCPDPLLEPPCTPV
ncbi:hypothetical protein [Limimaricola sp.]|uniref:hypothetical protein n=1 Tax=Limimaricola sp. TaxID=2211665 RepID=UPI00405A2DA5